MVNTYIHNCIIIPFEEFKDLMDDLYNLDDDILEPEGTAYGFTWDFYNSHLRFK